MRAIDVKSLVTFPEQFIREMLNRPADGNVELTVNAIVFQECGLKQEKQIDIEAYRISFRLRHNAGCR